LILFSLSKKLNKLYRPFQPSAFTPGKDTNNLFQLPSKWSNFQIIKQLHPS